MSPTPTSIATSILKHINGMSHTACCSRFQAHFLFDVRATAWVMSGFKVLTAHTFHKDLRSPNKFSQHHSSYIYHHHNCSEYFAAWPSSDHQKRHSSPQQRALWTQRVPLNALRLHRASHRTHHWKKRQKACQPGEVSLKNYPQRNPPPDTSNIREVFK
jgi:hypothetical protein